MKTYLTFTACSLMAIAASGLWGLGLSWGQDPPEESSPKLEKKRLIERREGGGEYGGSGYGRGVYGGEGAGYGGGGREAGDLGAYVKRGEGAGYGGGGRGMFSEKGKVTLKFGGPQDSLHAIREAAAALSAAEDDDARDDAERKLNELLDNYFDEDMKRREEELAAVEKRVRQLRELLERRREKKQDIIRLQVDVLRNEADGLGFFSTEGPGGPRGIFEHRLNVDPFSATGQPPQAVLPPGHPRVPYVPGVQAAPAVAPAPPSAIPR